MTALAQAVTEYLQLRRALGYKLEREGRELPRASSGTARR